ncbi:unnamed protein product [Caenorhabditis auriculariae]|uniref:Enhancer of rudimentary homolog n=1 Tax=Caenorhabditis auriculariae TaxID=2777116 RepID=A0A8S1HJP0_9PELO|nr:unnamed protein product [Caenorhabditis auriculariae]
MSATHTILLIQPTTRVDSRTWTDYETLGDCLEGVCKIFEEFLKKKSPLQPKITYDISQLYEFVDKLTDLSVLVFNRESAQYVPHNKDWIKQKIFEMLRGHAKFQTSDVAAEEDGDMIHA